MQEIIWRKFLVLYENIYTNKKVNLLYENFFMNKKENGMSHQYKDVQYAASQKIWAWICKLQSKALCLRSTEAYTYI